MNEAEASESARQLWLVPQQGQAGRDVVAEVAVAMRSPRLYSYAVPEPLREHVQPGVFVQVPYGRQGRPVAGVCVRVDQRDWDHTLRPISEVTSAEPLLTPALIELGLWVSEYYACPPGLTLTTLVPAAARRRKIKKVKYLRTVTSAAPGKVTPRQQRLLDVLAGGDVRRADALREADVGPAVATRLVSQGRIEIVVREEPVAPQPPAADESDAAEAPAACLEDAHVLTAEQEAALEAISAAASAEGKFEVALLFGVPGSGKTEVYVRAIRRVIAAGRQAILLVPEIALATQVVDRLARRFSRVAVLHSRLPDRARRETLHAIAAGAVDVVIGTRSAVFAPLPRPGLIVVDEEQDSSFKSLSAPLLHARDVAIKRAHIEHIPVVLGSATPALETWHNAQTLPHYRLLRLPERVGGARLPAVRIVSTDARALGQTTTVLSPELAAQLRATLADAQQALLLHNRRGYAVHLRCSRCRMTVSCQRCGAAMVYHQTGKQMRCHRCGVRTPVPERCLDETCGARLERVGLAIQRLEEELTRTLPEARLLRLDSDTMRRREDYAEALRSFEAGEADILLGTQMVAKGLDFPRVRLVGVIDADAILSLPDFRASEQVFQLVMQVVGRAGRREGESLALVQCQDADAPVIQHAVRMDYESFATAELEVRRRFFYPPFARMVRLILADARPGRAREEAVRLADAVRTLAAQIHPQIHVSEATACVVQRLRQMLRFQVIIRGPRDGGVQRLLSGGAEAKLLSPRVQRFNIDVDPVDLL